MEKDKLNDGANAIIGIDDVRSRCDISKATVYRLMKAGRFPPAVQLTPSGRRVGWRAADVAAWAAAPLDWGDPIDF